MTKSTLTIILFSFLLSYGIAEGSHRSFKFGSSVHLSESFKPKGKTVDESESSPPVKSSIAEGLSSSSSSVTSRLLSGTPANSSDDSSSSSGGSNVNVGVICAVLLTVIVIGLLWYIYRNRRNRGDDVSNATTQDRSTPKKNVLTPFPTPTPVRVLEVSTYPPVIPKASPRRGAATVTDHRSAKPIVNRQKVDFVVSGDVSDQYFTPPDSLRLPDLNLPPSESSSQTGGAPDSDRRDGRNALSVELERRSKPPAPGVSEHGISNSGPARVTELKVISTNDLVRRHNATAAAATVSQQGISSSGPSRDDKLEARVFSYKVLQKATGNFSQANILGKGAFGIVYKGHLSDNTKVAVKVLFGNENTKGDREFTNEIKAISLAKHKNIVGLVGYCITDTMKCIVCEFVENKTLDYHLQGGEGIKALEWPIRMDIAKGIAKGLAYLHNGCRGIIIHRDIKPANILLDHKFVAKVADFGIAKLCPDSFKNYIDTQQKGTHGYVDPTYWETGQLTFESDVYSFGVVLLQLVSAVTDLHTLYQLRTVKLLGALKSGKFRDIADPKLENNYVNDEMALMLTCAEACIRRQPKDRPSMAEVAAVLEKTMHVDKLKIKVPKRGLFATLSGLGSTSPI